MQSLKYALITPARNEEAFIEKTIQSVTAQTVMPEKWVVVSDGSTDRTDSIVGGYLLQHPLVRLPEHRDRHFAAKVSAFNAGYERLNGIAYDIIGNLDGDISFESGYIEYLLDQFAQNPQLGVAGTPFIEGKNSSGYNYNFTNIKHVSGACQLFRRQCFEEIGGYTPIKGGGIDWVAVTTARMKGWKTRTFIDKMCFHHRPMGTGGHSVLKARFKLGKEDYYLGGHPLWAFFRSIFQMKEKPYFIGGLLILSGYMWASIRRVKRPLSEELVSYHRAEQMERLKKIFWGMLGVSKG